MKLGKLEFIPITQANELVAQPIREKVQAGSYSDGIFAAKIDPNFADAELLCNKYDIPIECATNCIVVEAKRAERVWYAACLVLAEDMIDINGKVRRFLDARRVSFAPKDVALELTNMEYGSITAIGLPDDWPVLVDEKILAKKMVVMGGGLVTSKVLIETDALKNLPGVVVMDIAK